MKMVLGCLGLLVFCVVLLGMACLVERQRLCIRRQHVPLTDLPEAFDGFRIVQLSDLHKRVYPNNAAKLLHAVRQEQPDCIVITGDLVSRDVTDFSERQQLLMDLQQIAPVSLCLGNHELDLQPEQQRAYRAMIQTANCRLLENETIRLQRGTDICYLTGASLRTGLYHDGDFRYDHLEKLTAEELTADLGERQGCTVLLAHNPFGAEAYFAWGADLTLSGHVHGGVVRLPFVGGMLSPERKFLPKYSKGMYGKDGKWMYVNCGIGKLRLGNPPEIAVLVLENLSWSGEKQK